MTRTSVDVADLSRWIRVFAEAVAENKVLLTELDSAIGDADHGTNMGRGMSAVVAGLDAAVANATSAAPVSSLLKTVGMTLVSTVGGASGPLYGTFFLRMSTATGGLDRLDLAAFAAAMRAGLDGVVARGKAEPGDKTMYDALAPACDALDKSVKSGHDFSGALSAAASAADDGRDATIPMKARKGRASYLGERSVGHQDPGATSVALLIHSARKTLG